MNHAICNIVDFGDFPQISVKVEFSLTTESVYVKYRNNATGDVATVRFSYHENNAVRLGVELNGWKANCPLAKRAENELKYRLGLTSKTIEYGKKITSRMVAKRDVDNYEVADVTMSELYALPIGSNISQYTGKIAKNSRYLILGSEVEEDKYKIVKVTYTNK